MRAAISYQRALLNLVWDEVQDESSRNSQPHIGSDGAGTKGFTYPRQDLQAVFSAKCLQMADPAPRHGTWAQPYLSLIASAKENMPYSTRHRRPEYHGCTTDLHFRDPGTGDSRHRIEQSALRGIHHQNRPRLAKVVTMEDPVNDNMPKGGFVFIIIGKAYVEDDNDGVDIHVMLRAPDDDTAVRDALNALTEEGFAEADLDQIGTLMGAPDEEPHASAYQGALEGEVAIIRFG